MLTVLPDVTEDCIKKPACERSLSWVFLKQGKQLIEGGLTVVVFHFQN